MSDALPLLAPAAAAALLAFSLTPLAARLAVLVGAVDIPNERKIHESPTPRLGGLAVVTSIAIVWASSRWLLDGRWFLAPSLVTGIVLGILPILVVSIVDDIRRVGPRTKFWCHLAGATIAVACGIALGGDIHLVGQRIHLGLFALPLSVLWLVGITNAFNVIDGLDGLSAGLALIAALSMATVFLVVGYPAMAAAALVLAGALAGFLPYNVHPAKLFLGDTGATAVGFILGAFALRGGSTLSTGFAALVPVFVMGLPIADALISIARRLLVRLETHAGGVFVADRNHIHHRLLALGIDHGRAVLVLYGAGLLFAGAGLVSVFLTVREAGLFIVALILAGVIGMNRLGYDEFSVVRRGTVLRLYDAPVVRRSMFVVFVDLALVVVAAYVTVGLKLDVWAPEAARQPAFGIAAMLARSPWPSSGRRGCTAAGGASQESTICSARSARSSG